MRTHALLRAVIAASRILLEGAVLETALADALAIVGSAAGADRAFLWRYDPGSGAATRVAAWSVRGPDDAMSPIGALSFETGDDPDVLGALSTGDAFRFPRPSGVPGPRRRTARGRPRVVVLPVTVDERLWGGLGFAGDAPARAWSEPAIDVLRDAAATFSAAIRHEAFARAQTEAAVQDRVAAAGAHVAELAQANDMTRQTAARLTAGLAGAADADAVLAVFLREVVAVAGAAVGAVLRRVAGTEFEYVTLLDAGQIIAGEQLRSVPMTAVVRAVSRADLSGCFGRIVSGQTTLWTLDELDPWYPEYVAYWRARAVETVWHVPFTLRHEVVGYLGLAFRGDREPRGVVRETVAALASQIGLALELTRLVEEAKLGIVIAERDRIARDIHDTLAQGFAGVLLQLQIVMREAPDLPAAAVERLHAVTSLARENLIEARQAFRRLRTRPRLRPAFANALEQLVSTARRVSAVPISTRVDAAVDWLPGEVETELLRIVQEALTNALTHGQARHITLEMTGGGGGVRVIVQDDGRGFDPDTRADGFGLTSMSERAAHIGASLTVASAPGEGTEVIAAWPVEAPATGPRAT